MSLEDWGWSEEWARKIPEGIAFEPARVLAVYGDEMALACAAGECSAELSGRLRNACDREEDLPAVGDWVAVRGSVVDRVLPRRTLVSRRAPGGRGERQALAANVDVLFIVSGLDGDFNVRRLERYLVVARASGARPVFVLNKADVCAAPEDAVQQVRAAAMGCDVLLASAGQGAGIAEVAQHLPQGVTGALIGSSGVGKSTLLNRLLGCEAQAVREVRVGDSRGRHTTTHRQLFRLDGGGMMIDGPGLREIQLWADEEAVAGSFSDIATLAAACRFRDCRHAGEPGCAVLGVLDAARLESFHKLRREAEHVAREQDARARTERKRQIKVIERRMRRMDKRGP